MEKVLPTGESEENIEYPVGEEGICMIESEPNTVYGNPDYKPDVEQPNYTYPHPISFSKDTRKPSKK